MRTDMQKKLTRMMWQERLLQLLPAALIASVILAVMVYVFIPSKPISEQFVTGIIKEWTVPQTTFGDSAPLLSVQLDDGRLVTASSEIAHPPRIGDAVKLREETYESGRISFIRVN